MPAAQNLDIDLRKKTGSLVEPVVKPTVDQKLDMILAVLKNISDRLESIEINMTECLIALDDEFIPADEDFIITTDEEEA